MKIMWPLAINVDMDKVAILENLSHWSCISHDSNLQWMRADGKMTKIDFGSFTTAIQHLEHYDKIHPIGKKLYNIEYR